MIISKKHLILAAFVVFCYYTGKHNHDVIDLIKSQNDSLFLIVCEEHLWTETTLNHPRQLDCLVILNPGDYITWTIGWDYHST